ncbi:nucleolar pre-ribosomal-associated protein 1 domain-containing protein [Ditylenchus destructor]|nr:nucleolar pre-ribosomal-associated protein 1 domain-containing protein [Ditylenchus destructor]
MLDEKIDRDKVLWYFDQKKMWKSLLKITVLEREGRTDPEVYDARTVLCILLDVVKRGTEYSCRNFVNSNALSFCFTATSLRSDELRAFAFSILARYMAKLKELSEEVFREGQQYIYLIYIFKNSIYERNQRVPHVVSHFFARVSKLLMVPEDEVFTPIMAFLALKPSIDLQMVPEFLKLFFSGSTENFKKERQWIIRLCSESMLEPNDYNILCKSYVVEYCQALFVTPIVDLWLKLDILKLFDNCVQHESVVMDLFNRLNFLAWIVQAMEYHKTTDKEEERLVDIFVKIIDQVRVIQTKAEADPSEVDRKSRRKINSAKASLNPELVNAVIRINAERALIRIRKWDENDESKKWKKQLKKIVKKSKRLNEASISEVE